MQRSTPMNRLLQGDVGAGKTIVALLAALVAMENGLQVAFMAPTEILAEQHFLSLRKLLEQSRFRVELITGATTGPSGAIFSRGLRPATSTWLSARTRSCRARSLPLARSGRSSTSSIDSASSSARRCERKD